jgi:hypothetical protein
LLRGYGRPYPIRRSQQGFHHHPVIAPQFRKKVANFTGISAIILLGG